MNAIRQSFAPSAKATAATPPALMLVSALADATRRNEVARRWRPMPEYAVLERDYGVELFDWSRLGRGVHRRTPTHSLRHLAAIGLPRLRASKTIFSDGEHLGIPVALTKLAFGIETPHVMLGHHLSAARKRRLVRLAAAHGGIDRVAVHSTSQLEHAQSIGVQPSAMALIPYGIDSAFWSPVPSDDGGLILSPGREHRDHRTLARACQHIGTRVIITAASAHSPNARRTRPTAWPSTLEQASPDYPDLRRLYAAATMVVIPLLPADFPAGVTTLLEAMAMGKAIIVSATAGLRDYVRDGETALLVPPGDEEALRAMIDRLMADPGERLELGRRAHEVAMSQFGLSLYTGRLMSLLQEVQAADDAAVR